jgi:hypothetical protein
MTRTRTISAVVLLCGIALTSSQAQPPERTRDEALAKEFVYCAVVAQYWLERFTRPGAPDEYRAYADASRQQRDLFYVVAAIKSDGDFVKAERAAAIAKVMREIEDQTARGERLVLGNEARSCAELFSSKAVPLIDGNKADAR